MAACSGGGGNIAAPQFAVVTPTPAATVAPTQPPTSTPTAPGVASTSVTPGTTAVTATLPTLANGTSLSITLPPLAAGSGSGTVTASLSSTPPTGTPSLSTTLRLPQAVGSSTSAGYLTLSATLTSGTTLVFSAPISLTFTVLTVNPQGYGLAQFAASSGWTNLGLTAKVAGNTVNFLATNATLTNVAVTLSLFVLAPATPAPSNSPSTPPSAPPSGSPAPSKATPTPAATSLPTGATSVPIPGASNAAVALTGSSGGALSVTPFSTAAPAISLPANAQYFGQAGVSNTGSSAVTAGSATFSATLPSAPAAGSKCYLATTANGSTAVNTVPGTVNGTTFSITGNNVSVPPGAAYTYYVYCVVPPPTPSPAPTATPRPTATPTPAPPTPVPTATPKPAPAASPASTTAGAFNIGYPVFSVPAGSAAGTDPLSITGTANASFSVGGSGYALANSSANCLQGAAVTPNPAASASGVTISTPPVGTVIATVAIQSNGTSSAAAVITPVTTGAGANGGSCSVTLYNSVNSTPQTLQVLVTSASVSGS